MILDYLFGLLDVKGVGVPSPEDGVNQSRVLEA